MPEKKEKVYAPLPSTPSSIEAPKISLEFSLPAMDRQFMLKAPFLAVLFLLFTFSLFLLAESRVLSTEWLTEISRFEVYLMPRLFSPVFLLFLLFISVSFALSAFFGFGQSLKNHSLFALAATIVPALIVGIIYYGQHPNFLLAFIGLAIGVSSAAFFAIGTQSPKLSNVWDILGTALTVFTVIAVAIAFAVVSSDQDYYFDKFFFGLAKLAPSTLKSVAIAGASVVENYPIGNATVEGLIGEKEVAFLYSAFREDRLSKASGQVRTVIEAGFPRFEDLDESSKKSLVDAAKLMLANAVPGLKQKVAKDIRDFAQKEAEEPTAAQLSQLKTQLQGMSQFKLLKDFFPLGISIMLLSLVSILKIPVRAIGSIVTLGLLKL